MTDISNTYRQLRDRANRLGQQLDAIEHTCFVKGLHPSAMAELNGIRARLHRLRRDLAEVALELLLQRGHNGRSYALPISRQQAIKRNPRGL